MATKWKPDPENDSKAPPPQGKKRPFPNRQPLKDMTLKQVQLTRKEPNSLKPHETQQSLCPRPTTKVLPATLQPLPQAETEVLEKCLIRLEVDTRDEDDPFSCTEYVGEIYSHMMASERRPIYTVSAEFLSRQTNISDHHRSVLVDWLVQVQRKFMLLQETLYITVDILDRYLDVSVVPRQQLQLTGVTSMLLASKYEEIYPPSISDFVYICADAYTIKQIQDTERRILSSLGYELNKPFSLQFLRRYSKITMATTKEHSLAKYILEQALLDWKMSTIRPSIKAAAALLLAKSILQHKSIPSGVLKRYTGFTDEDLREIVMRLRSCLTVYHTHSKLSTIRKKYETVQFMEIAKIKEIKK